MEGNGLRVLWSIELKTVSNSKVFLPDTLDLTKSVRRVQILTFLKFYLKAENDLHIFFTCNYILYIQQICQSPFNFFIHKSLSFSGYNLKSSDFLEKASELMLEINQNNWVTLYLLPEALFRPVWLKFVIYRSYTYFHHFSVL